MMIVLAITKCLLSVWKKRVVTKNGNIHMPTDFEFKVAKRLTAPLDIFSPEMPKGYNLILMQIITQH